MAETVIFAVDVDPEVGQEVTKGSTRLDVIKQCINFFASCKKKVNQNHLFGIATLGEQACMTASGLTGSVAELANIVAKQLSPSPAAFHGLELGSLASLVRSLREDIPPVRIVLLYCRSNAIPIWTKDRSIGAPVDVIYVHEKPAQGINQPQEVYNILEEQADTMARLAGHNAYIFEASAPNIRKLTSLMVLMLAHPKTRPQQQHMQTSTPDLATMPLLPTSGVSHGPAAATTSSSMSHGTAPGAAAASTALAPPPGATVLGPFPTAAAAAAAAATLSQPGGAPAAVYQSGSGLVDTSAAPRQSSTTHAVGTPDYVSQQQQIMQQLQQQQQQQQHVLLQQQPVPLQPGLPSLHPIAVAPSSGRSTPVATMPLSQHAAQAAGSAAAAGPAGVQHVWQAPGLYPALPATYSASAGPPSAVPASQMQQQLPAASHTTSASAFAVAAAQASQELQHMAWQTPTGLDTGIQQPGVVGAQGQSQGPTVNIVVHEPAGGSQ